MGLPGLALAGLRAGGGPVAGLLCRVAAPAPRPVRQWRPPTTPTMAGSARAPARAAVAPVYAGGGPVAGLLCRVAAPAHRPGALALGAASVSL